jgi:hypothetical protein
MQRTATAQAPGKDFTTWDLPRLFAEIDRHFQQSLAAEKFLKATPISAWDDLIEKGTMPDSFRPTLYDFIAHEALEFYTSGEQAAAKPQDAFELPADSPIFLPAGEFLDWVDRLAGDTNAPGQGASTLSRPAALSSERSAPRLAFAAADLERLTWGWNAAFGEDKNARYKAALETFIRDNADFDISALATNAKPACSNRKAIWWRRTIWPDAARNFFRFTRRETLPQSRRSKSKPSRPASPPSASGTRRGRKFPFATKMWTPFISAPFRWIGKCSCNGAIIVPKI